MTVYPYICHDSNTKLIDQANPAKYAFIYSP